MAVKIKRDPFLKIEKAYRKTTAVTFFVALAVILSALIIVPLFGSSEAYWVMILYSVLYYIFCLDLAACAVLGAISCVKTKNEILCIQSVMHIISLVLSLMNCKLFTVFFLYGIKQDRLADKITGTDYDAFVTEAFSQVQYLLLALVISCILCVFSCVKLWKERNND